MILLNDIEYLGPWAWQRIGAGEWFPQGKSAMGEVDRNGNILWAAIYDEYVPYGSIKIHLAVGNPKSVTRRAISAVFEYPFKQLGVNKVLATVNSENTKSLSFTLRVGFRVEAVIEGAYEMGNMYILSMTREQCHWIRGRENGRHPEISTAAA